MIDIEIQRDSLGRIISVKCTGHADFAEVEQGGDIVCAAVSALTGFLGLAFSQELQLPGAVSAADGEFHLKRPPLDAEVEEQAVDLLLSAWVSSVRQLEENYSGWVKVVERL